MWPMMIITVTEGKKNCFKFLNQWYHKQHGLTETLHRQPLNIRMQELCLPTRAILYQQNSLDPHLGFP